MPKVESLGCFAVCKNCSWDLWTEKRAINSNGEETSLLGNVGFLHLFMESGCKKQCLKVREHAENFLKKNYIKAGYIV